MLVVSYGGSLLFDEKGINPSVKDFISFLKKNEAVVVVGGGPVARTYISALRGLGVSRSDRLDLIAIDVTRLNAKLLGHALSSEGVVINGEMPVDEALAAKAAKKAKLILMGGTVPGQTTDMVALKVCAAMGKLAERKLYNLTKVDGIFDSNPSENRNAKLIESITCTELERMWNVKEHKPGLNYPIEPQALSFAKDYGIEMFVVNGNDMQNFSALLSGKKWRGTHVLPR